MDTLWARYFEQIYPMGQFTKEFLDRMMLLNADYFNETLAMNDTTRALYVTGVVSKVVETFTTRISQDKDDSVNEKDVLKFYYWSDHDDSITMLGTAFGFDLNGYPPFASQIVFELWRHGNKSEGNQTYHVLMKINDANVTQVGACDGLFVCPIEKFTMHAKEISYYGRDEEYVTLCQNRFLSSAKPVSIVSVKVEVAEKSAAQYSIFDGTWKILVSYLAVSLLVWIGYSLYKAHEERKAVFNLDSTPTLVQSLQDLIENNNESTDASP